MYCTQCRSPIEDMYDLCWQCQKSVWEVGQEEVSVAYEKVVHETDKAWRVVFDESDPFSPKACWVPKSIAELNEDDHEVWVPRWFVEQESLEALDD